MSPLSWIAIALLIGVLTDFVTSSAARQLGRPYTVYHFIIAILAGWFILPLGVALYATGRLK